MTDTEILSYHIKRYPKMTPQDAVKLIYQSEFGCEHMISGVGDVLPYLEYEMRSSSCGDDIPAVEMLEGCAARINLAPLPRIFPALSPQTLASIFLHSSKMFCGSEDSFKKRLDHVRRVAEACGAPFTAREFDAYLDAYFSRGGGAVHHSDAYRAAYRPAYRVIHKSFVPYIPLFARLDAMLADGMSRFAVCIDGRCGSGKSTLASMLAAVYGCGVVHADDFYLPFGSRKGALGGLDAERMKREIKAEDFTYRAYDPHTDRFTHDVNVETSPFFVIEGSYSMSVECGAAYALRVFLTVGKEEQLKRIGERSHDKLGDFTGKWIPAEEKYFAGFSAEEKSDLIIKTDAFETSPSFYTPRA